MTGFLHFPAHRTNAMKILTIQDILEFALLDCNCIRIRNKNKRYRVIKTRVITAICTIK